MQKKKFTVISEFKLNWSIRQIYLFAIVFCFSKFRAQSPGGVPTNLQVWLKANAGVTTVGTASVSNWLDQSPNAVNYSQNTANLRPSLEDGSVLNNTSNYNPAIDFFQDGNRDFLVHTGQGRPAQTWFFVSKPEGYTNANAASGYATQTGVSTRNVHRLFPNINTSYNGNTDDIVTSTTGTISLNAKRSEFNNPTGAFISTYQRTNLFTPASNQPFSLGWSGDLVFQGRDWDGDIEEVIVYSGPTLSAANLLKIHSYLAVKYGITLSNDFDGDNILFEPGEGDYASSNGSIIWDADLTNTLYHNNIIGIGRDDAEVLIQKQSHTTDDSVRVYINNLATTNVANAGVFSANASYVIMGSNLGKMCSSIASNAEKPAACGLFSRIEREWKITNTNLSQTFNIDLTLNSCALTSSINVADLVLLVDDDGNFGAGTTNCYFNGDGTGLVFSYANPVITIRNISNTHLASGATGFITIASKNSLTPLPIELVNFKGNCDKLTNAYTLNWATATETNNDYFSIEKSKDAIDWQQIAKVKGAGNSISLKNYTYTDTELENVATYYRLKQIDFNGTETVYKNSIYNDGCGKTNGIVEFYPNPATKTITIKNSNKYNYYTIINSLGQFIKQSVLNEEIIEFENLSEGIYYLQLMDELNNTFTEKLIIIPN